MHRWPRRPQLGRAEELDQALLRRVAWRTALQSAAFVAFMFLLCAALVLLVEGTSQKRAVASQLASVTAHVDDVTDPPAQTWLYLQRPGRPVVETPGSPRVLPDRAGLDAVAPLGRAAAVVRDVDTPQGDFRIRTQASPVANGTQVVQAAESLQLQHQERSRLLLALTAAGGVALAGAIALGALTGRRSVSGLLETLRRQRTFVADASHELRTPLTLLATRSQLLRRRLATTVLPEGERHALVADADRLVRDSRRLNEVVEDLLAAAEPVQDRTVVVDLAAIAADVASSAEALAGARHVQLHQKCGSTSVNVRAGAAALRRSLLAMLDNAIRHTPAGGTVTVEVEGTATAGTIRIRDTGPGIAPELSERLFERLTTATLAEEGGVGGERRYGLGLALVAETAHRFGGAVAVESSPDGSCFSLSLPTAGSATA